MKLSFVALIFLFMGLLLIGCNEKPDSLVDPIDQPAALEKSIVTYHTGHDYPIAVLDPGQVINADGWTITKEAVYMYRLETTDPLITGNMPVTLTTKVDENGEGSCHGKWSATPDIDVEGGIWEGGFEGKIVKTGESEWKVFMQVIGQGRGGTIDGMQVHYEDVQVSHPVLIWYGTGSGYRRTH